MWKNEIDLKYMIITIQLLIKDYFPAPLGYYVC